jgi:hypothetical protein
MPSAFAVAIRLSGHPDSLALEIGEHRQHVEGALPGAAGIDPFQCNTVNSQRHPFSLNGQRRWPFAALGMDSIGMLAAPFDVSSYVSYAARRDGLARPSVRASGHSSWRAPDVSCRDKGDDCFTVSN